SWFGGPLAPGMSPSLNPAPPSGRRLRHEVDLLEQVPDLVRAAAGRLRPPREPLLDFAVSLRAAALGHLLRELRVLLERAHRRPQGVLEVARLLRDERLARVGVADVAPVAQRLLVPH